MPKHNITELGFDCNLITSLGTRNNCFDDALPVLALASASRLESGYGVVESITGGIS
jgi:hypothetical protein